MFCFQSYLDYFARALKYEYKDKGIVIQSLRPFYVNTKMTRYSKTLTSHSFLVPSAEEYARQAVATLGHSGRTTGYWPHTIQVTNFNSFSVMYDLKAFDTFKILKIVRYIS